MSNKLKGVKVFLVILVLLFFSTFLTALPLENEATLRFVYIPDLNLFPTPIASKREKHHLEKKYGLLIYESQAIFQELVRFINRQLDFDLVVFGGNNISNASFDFNDQAENFLHLFLDMASELKSVFLIVFGENELKTQNTDELIKTLTTLGLRTNNTWWSYKIKNHLLIGLNSYFLIHENKLAKEEIKWLKEILSQNKNSLTLIFLHDSVITTEGSPIKNLYLLEFFKLMKECPQVKLILSGGQYLNRIRLYENSLFLISSSPILFPCGFKLIEVTSSRLEIKTFNVPLKGIIKKAEMSLIESEFAKELFPDSPKSIKKHVLGVDSDSNFKSDF